VSPRRSLLAPWWFLPPDLPDECLVYLMGSRYCETDRLRQVAWDMFGALAP